MPQPLQPDNKRINDAGESRDHAPYVILLMDDEESITDSFGKLLEMKGFIVHTACNGEQAVAVYQRALSSGLSVDVAVIDLTIPEGMGGIETITRIKEIDPGVRAIATTGHFKDCLTFEFQKYGFLEILPKPFMLKELLEAIDHVIRKEKENPE